MAVLDSLFVKLGYDVDQEKVDDFNEGIEKTAQGMKKIVLSAIGAASALGFMVKKMADVANENLQISKNLDLPQEVAQAWRDAAEDMGLSSADAVAALTTVRTVQEDLAAGKPPSGEFLRGLSQIGLTLEDVAGKGVSADEALLKINKGLQTLDGAAQAGATSLLGMRGQFNLITDPRLGEAVRDNLRSLDTKNLQAFTKQWADFTQGMRDSWLIFTNSLAPAIGAALDQISKELPRIAKANADFINDLIEKPLETLSGFSKFVSQKLFNISDNIVKGALAATFESGLGQSVIGALGGPTLSNEPVSAFSSFGQGQGSRDTAKDLPPMIINNQMDTTITTNNEAITEKTIQKAVERVNEKAIGQFKTGKKG